LETLNFAQYSDFRDQDTTRSFRTNSQGTKVEFFDSGATAHFMCASLQRSAAEKENIDRIFEEVKAKGSRNLILDVRGNHGGQSDMAEHLFRYLYDGKFRVFSKVRAKASLDILPQLPLLARPLVAVLTGHVVSHSMGERAFRKPDAFFPGHAYLLIDNGSFSMATSFAAMFRDYKVGTIIGYETGGYADSFGGPHPFTLKNSRIRCFVSWTQNVPSKPRTEDGEHGVVPDVPLDEQKLADFRSEQDPVLAFTLRYIRSSARTSGDR
jgi:C-terminal processing protease CtpA/Prc